MTRHESPRTASRVRTLLPQPLHLAGPVHLVELEHGELHLLVLVLDLLRLGVRLLLPLLRATAETEDEVESGLLLDVVVGEGASVLQLLPGEDQSLLVRRDAFLVLDLGLDIVDGVGGLDFEGDCLPREGFHEDLHLCFCVSQRRSERKKKIELVLYGGEEGARVLRICLAEITLLPLSNFLLKERWAYVERLGKRLAREIDEFEQIRSGLVI